MPFCFQIWSCFDNYQKIWVNVIKAEMMRSLPFHCIVPYFIKNVSDIWRPNDWYEQYTAKKYFWSCAWKRSPALIVVCASTDDSCGMVSFSCQGLEVQCIVYHTAIHFGFYSGLYCRSASTMRKMSHMSLAEFKTIHVAFPKSTYLHTHCKISFYTNLINLYLLSVE